MKFEFEYSFNVQDDIYDNGTRIVYVFKMTTDQIPINMEPEKHDNWKLYSKKITSNRHTQRIFIPI